MRSQADQVAVTAPLTASNLTTNETYAAESRALYDINATGPYASPTADFLVFLPLQNFTENWGSIYAQAVAQDPSTYLPNDTAPEVSDGYAQQHQVLNEKLGTTDSAILEIIWADGATVLGLEHPYSRGSVKAASASIFDPPLADAGYLTNPLDVSVLVEGVKFIRSLIQAEALSPLQPFEVIPGANVTTDDDIAQFIRQNSATFYHPAGSCKIGAREHGGVVDENLKVYGIEGLRIVDASTMPLLPATHTSKYTPKCLLHLFNLDPSLKPACSRLRYKWRQLRHGKIVIRGPPSLGVSFEDKC